MDVPPPARAAADPPPESVLSVAAPAKVNLCLRVLGRRDDGFHEIETLMCPLDLADEIEVGVAAPLPGGGSGVTLSCDDPTLPTGPDNLAFRAAAQFLERVGRPAAVRLRLRKRVPHGAGLGGGSSDVAAVLRALNGLLGAGWGPAPLAALAAEISSDAPFFLVDGPAWCRGRGERVEPATLPAPLALLLCKPAFGVPTPWAYRRWKEARPLPGAAAAAPPPRFAWGELVNDLEVPVFEKFLFLAALKDWLAVQPEVTGALLSGSGSTVFAVLRGAPGETGAAEALRARVRAVFGPELWCHLTGTRTVLPFSR